MNEVEERLAGAFGTAAATVRPEDLTPLTVPVRPARRRRWTPAIAALAIAVIVAGGVLVNALRGGEGDAGSLAGSGRYLLTLPPQEKGAPGADEPPAIRDLLSGQVIRRVPVPSGVDHWLDVAGTAGNRAFFLLGKAADGARVYRLRIDPTGRVVELARLPGGDVPGNSSDSLVASADGATLAVVVDSSANPGRPVSQIRMLTVSTGRWTAWSGNGMAEQLSLSPDGRRLAFLWMGSADSPDGVRTLNTRAPAGDVLRHSRRIAFRFGRPGEVRDPWLGRNGLYVVSAGTETRLLATSGTGKVTATLLRRTPLADPSIPDDGPPTAGLGGHRPAFSVRCRSADARHVLLSGDKLEWFDLQTRKIDSRVQPDGLDGQTVGC
ncbi:hypothetical protein ACGFNU_43065 [Spirillospora sp. NPDC048911]|uniref:hypothetical protein n=1 Tax=Spirillospora sp. NPDC048911 TaxID=3364527 RepID=UPI0037115065